jgi:DNA-binding response OmpR family regulator
MNEGATVLVVEDDGPLRSFLRTALGAHGYRVLEAQTLGEATIVVTTHNPEVVLLDLGLPDGDGLEVLRELRRVSDVPVIIATARGEETDRIVGLELGADDYVVKPFSVRELAARVRAVARRRRIDTSLDSGRLVVDRARHRVVLDGTPVELTAKEFDLLAVLAEEPGRAVPRQELFSRVWDPVWIGTGKTLDVHIASLRKKLGDAELIETVRGVGYRLAVDSA